MFRAGLPLALCILLALLGSFLAPQARASGQSEKLRSTVQALNAARGPEAYTTLREIWRLWGGMDPMWVEEALADASASRQLSPRVREYAEYLVAHARTRRGDVSGAKRLIAQLGLVREWVVLGPFDNEGKGGFSTDHGPEAQFNEVFSQERAYSGKERPVRWRLAPDAFYFGWLDGSSLFRPEQHICVYAATFLKNEGARPRDVELLAGASGAFKLFVNGRLVLEDDAYRGHDIDRRGVEMRLPTGSHNLTVKACNTEQAPVVSLRAVPSDRKREGLAVSADLTDSQSALANYEKGEIRKKALGALDAFEAQVERKTAGAADFENYARYLLMTGGDDPATHEARDYARRAAEAEPNVERQLLAGELAEDYNQHRIWVEQAEALAEETDQGSAELSLARATVEQSGLNWRDAFPHYTEARRLDRDNLQAVTGVVSLLNEAGLRYTGLQVLEESVERNPNSVTLLNMYASALRVVGREQRADEVEARYAQFRFDDHTYLTGKINLALARDNRAAAEHWTERLLELNPASLWAHSTAASTYRGLGQSARAVESYERALELAPEDIQIMRALSDLKGELGERAEQVRMLEQIVELRPQAKDVQEYLAHIEPEEPQKDEAYAWQPDRFLKKSSLPAKGESRRTLLDLTVTTVFENGLSSEFRQVVFQPLVDSAAALSQHYSFQYQADRQRVQLRGARVFRADGRINEAIDTGVSGANDPSIAMYTSARTFSVRFPRLEPGDVVELRYRLDDVASRNEFADYFGDLQYLQSDEFTGHAEYVLITPETRKLHVDHRGIPGLKTKTEMQGEERIYRYWAEDIPPILPEPKMPQWQEVLGFIHVSTYANYQELGKWYWGLAQDQFDLDDETRKLAREITEGLTTEREKVAAVYNWVIKNTRYVALEFGIYGFKPRRCVQTVSRGWGDCKDKATVIVTLLDELDIDSTIVIVRTQMRGNFKSNVASLSPFDHAIAYVPSLDLYLDGTAEYTGASELPAMDHGALGILVNEGNSRLVTLPRSTPEESARQRTIKAQLKADASAKIEGAFDVRGTNAPSWRRRYSAKATQRERIVSDLSQEFPGLELLPKDAGLRVDVDDFDKPVVIEINGNVPNYARIEGDTLTLPVTTRVRLLDEYASLSKRKLDVRIGTFGSVQDRFEIELPKGYRIEDAPDEVDVDTRFGSYRVSVSRGDGRITVESRIGVKVARVSPQEYPAWRAFCQDVDNAMSPRLILAKK